MKLMKLIAMPGHLIDTKCHLIVPEKLFLEHFLWFSAELFAHGDRWLLYECHSVALSNLAINHGLAVDNIQMAVTLLRTVKPPGYTPNIFNFKS